jgi:hypothetical protein
MGAVIGTAASSSASTTTAIAAMQLNAALTYRYNRASLDGD